MADSEISKANKIDDIGSHAKLAEAEVGARLGAEAVQALSSRGGCGSGSRVSDTAGHRHHGPILYPLPDVDIHVTVNANPGEVRPGKRVQ